MSINERFFYLLEKNNITQKEFSQKTGIPTQTISGWKNRKTDPPASLISSIADFFNVSYEFLLTGKESNIQNLLYKELTSTFLQLSSSDQREIIEFMKLKIRLSESILYDTSASGSAMVAEELPPYGKSSVPILGYVAAGEPILSYENEINTMIPENSKVSYALIAKGNSMEPIIQDKEIIEVICQEELENGEIGIIKINENIACKRFYNLLDHYELKSLNADYDTITIPKSNGSEVKIVGKVSLTQAQQSRFSLL